MPYPFSLVGGTFSSSMRVSRRVFVGSLAAAAAVRVVRAQEPSPWKSPVLDGHLHLRREVAANLTHMDGCGVTQALILARDTGADQINEAAISLPTAWCGLPRPTSRHPAARRG